MIICRVFEYMPKIYGKYYNSPINNYKNQLISLEFYASTFYKAIIHAGRKVITI